MATSYDGRLIVVACLDGSLRCYNSTPSSLQHRWTITDAHSHVTQNVSSSPSKSRAHGAGKSGPVRSLSFSPTSYVLLLADAGREQLSMYNAAESQPTISFVDNFKMFRFQVLRGRRPVKRQRGTYNDVPWVIMMDAFIFFSALLQIILLNAWRNHPFRVTKMVRDGLALIWTGLMVD